MLGWEATGPGGGPEVSPGRAGGAVAGVGRVSEAFGGSGVREAVPARVPGAFVVDLLEDTGMMDRGRRSS